MATRAENAFLGTLGAAAVLLALACARPACAGELTFSTAAGERLALADLVPRLRPARFLLLGEQHGNYRHHDVQIRIMAALRAAGVPLAVGLEAFPTVATPALARWVAGDLDAALLYRLFDDGWSLENWSAYRDLLFFLRDSRIPSAGINAEKALVARVAREGYAALSAAELSSLPPGRCVADARYRALIGRVLGVGAQDDQVFSNFCEAQSLRDALLARGLAELAAARPGHLVAALTGFNHAWRPAVPARLEELAAGSIVVILPEEALRQPVGDLAREVDYFWHWRD